MMGDGVTAVRLARKFIVNEVTGREQPCETLSCDEPSGVFVTINRYPSMELRGCIGFPMTDHPLSDALEHSARSACNDPRFPALNKSELDRIVVEVTLLTAPEEITVESKDDLLDSIKIGKHGLMLEHGRRSALFLPQVPSKWNVRQYLENLCMKAGLPRDGWKDEDCILYSFEGKVFKETSPNGEIAEVR
jgi:AmmeMemoRadiSam system protein A